jgi:pilus assembly protein TadC
MNKVLTIREWINRASPIICVGLIGCFLTSVTGVSAVMLVRGWSEQGGWVEWSKRIAIGYPASTIVVFLVFPWMVPRLTKYFTGSSTG